MPLLYETYAGKQRLQRGIHKIGFRLSHVSRNPELTRQNAMKRLLHYNWLQHGLELKHAEVIATPLEVRGTLTLEVHQSFVVWPFLVVLIPAILGFVATIAKLWVIREVTSPLLAPGPLGLPMIAWVFITAAGVLIPLSLILRRK